LLVVATATPAARQAFSLAQLKSYCKAIGFGRRHALQQEQSLLSRQAAAHACSRARLPRMIVRKIRLAPPSNSGNLAAATLTRWRKC
jgi:hypothetical protein